MNQLHDFTPDSELNSSARILTVCIPTRNRAQLLRICLDFLAPVLSPHKSEIALMIIDNASEDETGNLVTRWISDHPQITTNLITKTSNTGIMDSIFLGIESSASKYFMFIGDDDTLSLEGLSRLIRVLKSQPTLAILIESDRGEGFKDLNIEEPSIATNQRGRFLSGSALYKFGNAWAGIYNVQAMKEVLGQSELRDQLVKSLWGQAELGFMAAETSNLMIGTVMFTYGSPHSPNPFNPGGLTSILSARCLLESSRRLDADFSSYRGISIQLGDRIKSPVTQHLIAVLRTWPSRPSETYLLELSGLRDLIKATFSFNTGFWIRALRTVSFFPSVVRFANSILNFPLDRTKKRSDSNLNHYS